MGEGVGEGTEYITLQTVPGGISGQEETMDLHKMQEQVRLLEAKSRECYNDNCFEAAKIYWQRATTLQGKIDSALVDSQQDVREFEWQCNRD